MPVTTKRRILNLVVVVLIAAFLISIFSRWREVSESKRVHSLVASLSYDRIDSAIHKWVDDTRSRGLVVPSTVSLHELMSTGYLMGREVRGLEHRDVAFTTQTLPIDPSEAWITVRLSRGREVIGLGDGSIQQRTER
jgi:hypothetical protein